MFPFHCLIRMLNQVKACVLPQMFSVAIPAPQDILLSLTAFWGTHVSTQQKAVDEGSMSCSAGSAAAPPRSYPQALPRIPSVSAWCMHWSDHWKLLRVSCLSPARALLPWLVFIVVVVIVLDRQGGMPILCYVLAGATWQWQLQPRRLLKGLPGMAVTCH